MKTRACKCCSGSGKEVDQKALGDVMRSLREAAGLSLEGIGSKVRPKRSKSYLSELEHGTKNWNPRLVEQYKRVCV